jgi:hypothetical protein
VAVNLYITLSDKNKIKRCFLNLRKYLVVSAQDVIENIGYTGCELDDCSMFLVNEEIKKLIQKGSVRRKLLAVVYTNPDMNDEIIRELIHFADELPSIDRVIFLTEESTNEELYELFSEVAFFPSMKKVHIIECLPFPINLDELDRDLSLTESANS